MREQMGGGWMTKVGHGGRPRGKMKSDGVDEEEGERRGSGMGG